MTYGTQCTTANLLHNNTSNQEIFSREIRKMLAPHFTWLHCSITRFDEAGSWNMFSLIRPPLLLEVWLLTRERPRYTVTHCIMLQQFYYHINNTVCCSVRRGLRMLRGQVSVHVGGWEVHNNVMERASGAETLLLNI